MTATIGPMLIDILPRLRRYALALARTADTADDLVQAACERALATKAELTDAMRFDGWMFRILRNIWLDRLRRQKTRGTEVDVADTPLAVPGGDTVPEHRLLLGKAAAAIAALPDEQREIMLLVCVEDFSYREAAELLDLPIGTVMSRLARARKKVADEVGVETGRVL